MASFKAIFGKLIMTPDEMKKAKALFAELRRDETHSDEILGARVEKIRGLQASQQPEKIIGLLTSLSEYRPEGIVCTDVINVRITLRESDSDNRKIAEAVAAYATDHWDKLGDFVARINIGMLALEGSKAKQDPLVRERLEAGIITELLNQPDQILRLKAIHNLGGDFNSMGRFGRRMIDTFIETYEGLEPAQQQSFRRQLIDGGELVLMQNVKLNILAGTPLNTVENEVLGFITGHAPAEADAKAVVAAAKRPEGVRRPPRPRGSKPTGP